MLLDIVQNLSDEQWNAVINIYSEHFEQLNCSSAMIGAMIGAALETILIPDIYAEPLVQNQRYREL